MQNVSEGLRKMGLTMAPSKERQEEVVKLSLESTLLQAAKAGYTREELLEMWEEAKAEAVLEA